MIRRLLLLVVLIGASGLLPGLAQADSTWYVGSAADGCPNAQFATLTSAVTYAQSHDTIRVCPGTYTVGPLSGTTATTTTQGLVIDKALTIIGAGASKVTIEPAANLVSATSTTDNLRDQYGNVITVEPPPLGPTDTSDTDINVAISGVTITNAGFLVDSGVSFYNSAGSISSSTVAPYVGSPAGPVGDPNVGWGVVASDAYAVTPQGAFERDVTVSGDAINTYGGGGVLIDGSEASKPIYFRSGVSTTGSITNNVITGTASSTAMQQYGIQVNAGGRAAISGNYITGNLSATPGTASSPGNGVGILLTDADLTSTPAGSTSTYTSVSGNDLLGNGYGLFNGTADFPGAAYPTGDSNATYPIDVNGTGTTPTNLPASLTNTAQSTSTVPVTVSYGVAGVALAQPSKANWYGPDKGVTGGPSSTTDDGYSESTTTAGSSDSVKTGTIPATMYAPPSDPAAVVDAFPTAAWGTPDGVADTTVTAGQANELLVLATDDFGVSSVDLNAAGSDLGTESLPPYEASWTPSTSLIGQTVPLVATVTDEDGQVTTATIDVSVVAAAAAASAGTGATSTGAGSGTATSGSSTATGGSSTGSSGSSTGSSGSSTGSSGSSGPTVTPAALAPEVEVPSILGPFKSVLRVSPTLSSNVTKVVYTLDGKVVCSRTASPFTCSAKLTGSEVGGGTLVISATAANGLVSSVARRVLVEKFKPSALIAAARAVNGAVSVTGKLKLPSAVSHGLGYRGKLTLVYGKRRTTSTVGSAGKFRATLGTVEPGKKVKVTFDGNGVLTTLTRTITVG